MQEDELIERSKQGDKEAFSDIVIKNQSKIFNLCLSMVKDEKAAEDLTQEVFLKAYEKLSTFQQKSQFSTWLYRIAYNHCLNFLKKKNRTKEEEFKETILINEPESEFENGDQLQEAMNILSAKQRIIFDMYYIKKIPQKQIAVALNVPLGTVRSRLHYAKKKMKNFYNSFNKFR